MAAVKETSAIFAQWVCETFNQNLHLDELEGGKAFHDLLRSPDYLKIFSLSAPRRVQNFHITKFTFSMQRAGNVAAVFRAKVREGHGDKWCEVAFGCCIWPPEIREQVVIPKYLSFMPSYESQDGEYRSHYYRFETLLEKIDEAEKLLAPYEEFAAGKIAAGDLEITAQYFPEDAHHAAASCEDNRLALTALKFFLARVGTCDELPAHMTAELHRFAKKLKMPRLYKNFDEFIAILNVISIDRRLRQPYVGMKVVPLTQREVYQPGDITFAPWRELWVGQNVADLIVNGIAPNFPITGTWSFLDGVTRDFYENRFMLARFARSEEAKKNVEALRVTRAQMLKGNENSPGMDAKIYEAIEYAQGYLTLSDIALCSLSEYVGDTFMARARWYRGYNTSFQVTRAFEDPYMQTRYVFDLCYGAHAMHTRTGAIHCDLHANNITLGRIGTRIKSDDGIVLTNAKKNFRYGRYKVLHPNAIIAYVVGKRGALDTYLLPHDGGYGFIIDFSRAVLGGKARERVTRERGEAFASGFFRAQAERIVRVLELYAPDYVKKRHDQILGLALSEPEAIFRVLASVDFLAIGRSMGAVFREAGCGKTATSPDAAGITVASALEQRALDTLVDNLTALAESGTVRDEFPGETIIREVFGQYSYSSWAAGEKPCGFSLGEANLTTIYNITAPLTYSATDYAHFPPWGRFDEIEKHLGGLTMDNVVPNKYEKEFVASEVANEPYANLVKTVQHELEERPPAAAKDW